MDNKEIKNDELKFEELLKEIKEINWEKVDEKIAEKCIKSMSFIFDISKKSNPISYAVFYFSCYGVDSRDWNSKKWIKKLVWGRELSDSAFRIF